MTFRGLLLLAAGLPFVGALFYILFTITGIFFALTITFIGFAVGALRYWKLSRRDKK